MAPAVHDTRYLQEVVGDALSRGCAATVAAQPNDPVEYLGQWLLRFVKNAEIVGEFSAEKEQQLQLRKANLEAAAEAAAKAKHEAEKRREAVVSLVNTPPETEPRVLLQHAAELIVKFTAAGAAYAAVVAEPEDAEWTPPEDPEDPAAAESDDEPDPPPPAPPVEGEEGAAPADGDAPPADGEAAEGAADGDADAAAAAEKAKKPQRPLDYSKKYLSYLAATAGQEFLLTTELRRPPPPPEDDPEAKPEPTPLTFKILDERRPMIYSSNASFEPSVRFFRGFPKIGAYQACGVQSPATGEFKAVIAADTLFPEGGGQALSQEDQDFIWHVSRALSQAFDAIEARAVAELEGRSGKDAIQALKASITNIYYPPPPEPTEDQPPEGAPPPAEEPPAAPAEGEGAPPAEGEAAGDDPISLIKSEIKDLEGKLKEAEAARVASTSALEKAQGALDAIKETLVGVAPAATRVLRSLRLVPQATFKVLKAVLHVLGKDPETFSNWKRAFQYFGPEFFAELKDHNATQDRDAEQWKRARCAYKALGEDGAKKLEVELPDSHLGVLLLMWLRQVRKVARKAAAFRASLQAEEQLGAALEGKRTDLQAAEQKKAEEEEAARKAAEEAAAAEAAAAAAGEGGEGGEAPAEGEGE